MPDAIGMLRLLLVATILVPLSLGSVAAYLSYLNDYAHATSSASQAVAVASENTTKVLDTHLLVAARINDLLGAMTDEQIHAAEKDLHDRIGQQIASLPEVAAAWVIDASGRELVSARVYPVNGDINHSTREDFNAFRGTNAQAYVWMLRARNLDTGDYEPFFTVSLRRTNADSHFNGMVVVAVSGAYFGSFYNSLLGGAEHYTASVLRDDGSVLARYPQPIDATKPPKPDPLLAEAIANESHSEIDEDGTPFNGGRLVAINPVGAYPVYVTIERTKISILQSWLRSILGYILMGVPAEIALVGLTLLAMRRTRREQLALAQASEAAAQRSALELTLSRSQRLEAVGLLTAGIVHDFNNLLMVVWGNVERLEISPDADDAQRQQMINAAKDACARADSLSKRLLGLSRHEPVTPRPTDINAVVVNTLELPWKSGERITRNFRLDDALWPASVDPGQLATALLNLAFNARDAMSGGGTLTIETVNLALNDNEAADAAGLAPGDYVGIFVGDTGHGMPEDVRQKAFDPFFTTKEPGKGTGLGLALVGAFATRSGGACAIDSEPGRGTTVKIYLPRHSEAAEKASAKRSRRVEAEPTESGDHPSA
ncbi:MAG TPA: ATP-binding protein [Stellaceae bacterium]|jgi:two-component system NtrC family sensor kinase|nr:ATP-binding protein [Stellaceae bacterium]